MSSIKALINPLSGSVPENAADLLRALLADLGETCDVTMIDCTRIVEQIDECIAAKPDVIIMWSGDGTIATALERAGPDGPPILPLPGGTMNLFHKQIHRGLGEWNEVLRNGLTEGKMIDVPAGCADDRRFYVAAMAGSLTDLAATREAFRKGHLLEAAEALSGSDLFDLRSSMTFSTEAGEDPAAAGFATAAAIFVGDGESSDFEFAYIDPDNPLELAAAGIGALVSDWREAAGVTLIHTRDVTLTDEKGYELRVTLDGEQVRLKSGTRFTRLERGGRAISAHCE